MPIANLNNLLEILSEEKAEELRMMLESPYMRSQKNTNL